MGRGALRSVERQSTRPRVGCFRFSSTHTRALKNTHTGQTRNIRLGQPYFPFPLPPVSPGLELQDGEPAHSSAVLPPIRLSM